MIYRTRLLRLVGLLVSVSVTASILSLYYQRNNKDSIVSFYSHKAPANSDPFQNVMNSTLGFENIIYINMPNRFDRDDAMFIQSEITGLALERMDGVDSSQIDKDGKGLPPSSGEREIKPAAKACLRSHAQLWKQMLKEKWSSLLVLEADAAWDKNVKKIHRRIAEGLHKLQKTQYNITWEPDMNDPFGSKHWDVLSFGTCHQQGYNKNESILIFDPDVPDGLKYYGEELDKSRAIRKSGGMVCTTGYAISPSGAQKMLLNSAIDSSLQVDLLFNDLIHKNQLVGFSVYPPSIGQWGYTEGIGAENLGSSIDNHKSGDTKNAEKVWKSIKEQRNIWTLRAQYKNTIKNLALAEFNRIAYNQSSTN